ncbi:MAG: phosphoribosylformylglycinamidine synthase subunit PurS [Thermodesulfobacteriota bacterium]
MIARVFITPKKGVLDPQGRAISSSLHSLGFGEVADVRMGKYLEIRLDPAQGDGEPEGRVRAMCERLLANGVIEDFRFEIDREANGRSEHDA